MDHGMLSASPAFVVWADVAAAAVADAGIPVIEGDLELADRKRRCDGDAVLRLGLLLSRRRAHGELPGRDHHHVRATGAIPELGDGALHAPDLGRGDKPLL